MVGAVILNIFLPLHKLHCLRLFIEYQYQNILNADVGYIAFDNSPWLAEICTPIC